MKRCIRLTLPLAAGLVALALPANATALQNDKPPAKRENFTVAGHKAFVIVSPGVPTTKPKRWVWYAPTLGKGLPGGAEKWMFDRFHRAGIAREQGWLHAAGATNSNAPWGGVSR